MKINRSIKIVVGSILILLAITYLFFGSSLVHNFRANSSTLPKEMPKDFNFVAVYGKYEGNKLNTFKSEYTKVIDWDKDTTIRLVLSQKQKRIIYKRIRRYGFIDYPKEFLPDTKRFVDPSPSYYIKFGYGKINKEIEWNENTFSKERRARNLRNLFILIDKMINENSEVQNLSIDKRGFL